MLHLSSPASRHAETLRSSAAYQQSMRDTIPYWKRAQCIAGHRRVKRKSFVKLLASKAVTSLSVDRPQIQRAQPTAAVARCHKMNTLASRHSGAAHASRYTREIEGIDVLRSKIENE